MKKWICAMLAYIMIFTVFPMMAGAQKTEENIVFNILEQTDSTVKVEVYLEKNPGFVSATIPVMWKSAELSLKSVEEYDIHKRLLEKEYKGIDENSYWVSYPIEDVQSVVKSGETYQRYHLAWNYDTMYTGDYEELNFTKNGTLCVMEFKIEKPLNDGNVYKIFVDEDEKNFISMMNWDMKNLVQDEVPGVTVVFGEGIVTLAEKPEEEPKYLPGDIDMNGNVDLEDALFLLQYSIFPDDYKITYPGNIDFIQSNSIDIDDALYVLQHSLFPDDYPID